MAGLGEALGFCWSLARFLFWYAVGAVLWLVPLSLRPKKDVKDQVVLVTGAGSGLGRALALRLASRGARLVLWDLKKQWVEETQQLIRNKGGRAWSFVCDVSDRKAVKETALKVKHQVGTVSILINNAGVLFGKPLLDLEEEAIIKTMEVNCLAHFWTCRAFLPDMLAAGRGHVVCVASTAAFLGAERLTDYCASKHAALGMARALRAELGPAGLALTVVCPYFFSSGFYRGLGQGLLPEVGVDQVADRALQAVLTETFLCYVPGWVQVLTSLTSLTPCLAEGAGQRLLGLSQVMKNFTGARHVPLKKTDE